MWLVNNHPEHFSVFLLFTVSWYYSSEEHRVFKSIKPEHMNKSERRYSHYLMSHLTFSDRELWKYRQQRVALEADMHWIDLVCLLNTSVVCVRTSIPVYRWLLGVSTCVCVCVWWPPIWLLYSEPPGGDCRACSETVATTFPHLFSPFSLSLFLSADRGDFLWADVSRFFDAQLLQWCVRLGRQASFSAAAGVKWLAEISQGLATNRLDSRDRLSDLIKVMQNCYSKSDSFGSEKNNIYLIILLVIIK